MKRNSGWIATVGASGGCPTQSTNQSIKQSANQDPKRWWAVAFNPMMKQREL